MVCDVKPSGRVPRCSECGRCVRRGYDKRKRTWRHLDLAGMKTTLRYEIRRVDCPRCGVKVEQVPWADAGSNFTRPFEEHTGYLAQQCAQTTVMRLMRVAWRTVGTIIRRVVDRHQETVGERLDGLRLIGVDELSYRRHHKYVTVVVDHERGEIVWAREGKSAATLKCFFDDLGPDRSAKLEAVTIDLSAAYIKAVTEASPGARLIFDRFHVQRLAHDALDEVRREEVRKAVGDDKEALKRTRWSLQKNPWNLVGFEHEKLAGLQKANGPIYRAYLLKESLLAVLDRRQVNVAKKKLEEWIDWARRSRLPAFVRLSRTIAKHSEGILAYVQTGANNGRVEGLNGKARTITRRSHGFHSASALIAMLFLCCGGVDVSPAHVRPGSTH
ncbi:MAG: ISL3 family transposase [bacterium]|nr:ISL3 family transposase [bacterium]